MQSRCCLKFPVPLQEILGYSSISFWLDWKCHLTSVSCFLFLYPQNYAPKLCIGDGSNVRTNVVPSVFKELHIYNHVVILTATLYGKLSIYAAFGLVFCPEQSKCTPCQRVQRTLECICAICLPPFFYLVVLIALLCCPF